MAEKTTVKLGGLWENKDRNGNTYYSGTLGMARVLIFANGYKESERHPDWIMYLAPKEKREDSEDNPTDVVDHFQKEFGAKEDDIPF